MPLLAEFTHPHATQPVLVRTAPRLLYVSGELFDRHLCNLHIHPYRGQKCVPVPVFWGPVALLIRSAVLSISEPGFFGLDFLASSCAQPRLH
jgi:hypothetical protein